MTYYLCTEVEDKNWNRRWTLSERTHDTLDGAMKEYDAAVKQATGGQVYGNFKVVDSALVTYAQTEVRPRSSLRNKIGFRIFLFVVFGLPILMAIIQGITGWRVYN